MQAELENYKSNEINLNVSEDISILYIVQHELLNEKEVEFAGVVLKHQLKEDFSFRIVTKKSKPLEIWDAMQCNNGWRLYAKCIIIPDR